MRYYAKYPEKLHSAVQTLRRTTTTGVQLEPKNQANISFTLDFWLGKEKFLRDRANENFSLE